MPPDEQPRPTSTSKKIKCYTKYCLLILACCTSIFVIPGVYLHVYHKDNTAKTPQDILPIEFERRSSDLLLPWYMVRGVVYPETGDEEGLKIWPEEDRSDRIESQLMFRPIANESLVKTILTYNKLPNLDLKVGQDYFYDCPIVSCSITDNVADIDSADAVLFSDEQQVLPTFRNGRPPRQVWILSLSQNPHFTKDLRNFSGLINWTVSYRSDSDIVAPFGKWVYYNRSIRELPEVSRNYAAEKTKKVVWFVKDFSKDYSRRREYAEQLGKYIDLDIFGRSDVNQCPCLSAKQCFELLNRYKFFLSFENSNCRDYIKQKFFISLQRGVLPVVMGAPLEDFVKCAPQNSYIHVDNFTSPQQLAEHLHRLDQDDGLYNSYFRWRGTGEMIDTRFECRLCALLHSGRNKTYSDLNSWWKGNTCNRKLERF